MRDQFRFDGGVAVITGAASGLGLAMAQACATRGMRLVLVDIDADNLERVAANLAERVRCLPCTMDIRDRDAFERLAARTFAQFGQVDVLFNNAGAVITRPVLETRVADWRWMLEVNLWSVINGIDSFLPRMLAQGREARICNTASAAGFLSEPNLGAYAVSKHAVVALSETLDRELKQQGTAIGVTILNPAFIPTRIVDSERARPADLAPDSLVRSPAAAAAEAQLRHAVEAGRISAAQVAERVLDAIARRRLHVFTHAKIRQGIEARMAAVYAGFEP